ncbi:MAG: 6-pyruvoyl-tetrahydropterin synthase-related protein [Candidatus Baldrarchaeia archaeon]
MSNALVVQKSKTLEILNTLKNNRILFPLTLLFVVLFSLTFPWLISPFPSYGSDFYGLGMVLDGLPIGDVIWPSLILDWYFGTTFTVVPMQVMWFFANFFYYFVANHLITWKLYFFSVFLLSGIFMYLYLLKMIDSMAISLFGAFFYMYTPYHIVETILEGQGHLSLGYSLIPLVFLSYELLLEKITLRNIIFCSFSTALIILSHPQVFPLYVLPFLIIYFGTRILLKKFSLIFLLKKSLFFTASIISGLLISMFWWFPFLMEGKYYYGGGAYSIEQSAGFHSTSIIQTLTLSCTSLTVPEIFYFMNSPLIFLISLIIPLLVFVSIYFILKDRNKKGISMIVPYSVSMLLALGLSSPIPLYEYVFYSIPLLSFTRTPIRFLQFTCFSATILICLGLMIAFQKMKLSRKKKRITLVFLTITIMLNAYTGISVGFQTFNLPWTLMESYAFIKWQPYGRLLTVPITGWVEYPGSRYMVNPMLWTVMYNKECVVGTGPMISIYEVGSYLDQLWLQGNSQPVNLETFTRLYGIDYVWVNKKDSFQNYILGASLEKIFENSQYVVYKNNNTLPKLFLLEQRTEPLPGLNCSWYQQEGSKIFSSVGGNADRLTLFASFSNSERDWLGVANNIDLRNYTLTDMISYRYEAYNSNSKSLFGQSLSLYEIDGSRYIMEGFPLQTRGEIEFPIGLLQLRYSEDENNQLDLDQVHKIEIGIFERGNFNQNTTVIVEYSDFKIVKNVFLEANITNLLSNVSQNAKKYLVINYAWLPNWNLRIDYLSGISIQIPSTKVLYFLNGFDITYVPMIYVKSMRTTFEATSAEKLAYFLSISTITLCLLGLIYEWRKKRRPVNLLIKLITKYS